MDQKEWQEERAKLDSVLGVVRERLTDARQLIGEHAGRAQQERRLLWEEGPRQIRSTDDWIELAQASAAMGQQERSESFYRHQARRLEKMLSSPYFARLDFTGEDTAGVDRIYIGIGALHDGKTGEGIVYDWRAPICSLFYDVEPGPAQYECQDGIISGSVLLKRQYKIRNGNLEYMFDTDLKIDDEVLQELLGRHVDEKMRTIVTSIQREQNRVIRDSGHDLLLVQGPAGSGKTAIALHRAAYLLYKHRDSLTARNIVILSPNRVFGDYISAVLPELGEENVLQTTFGEYAEKHLGSRFQVESIYDQLEYLFSTPGGAEDDWRRRAIELKASPQYLRMLQLYAGYLEGGRAMEFFDVRYREQVVMSADEMARLFTEQHRDLPLTRRLEKIRQRVLFLLQPLEERRRKEWQETLASGPERMFDWEIRQESRRRTREEFEPVKGAIAAWASFDVDTAYRRLFTDAALWRELAGGALPQDWPIICRQTLGALNNGRIWYEDVGPLLYLKRVLEGSPVMATVRHVIVDEGQDYTPLQYELFSLVFPRCSLTVLGDLSQTVHPHMHIGSYEAAMAALHRERGAFVRLTKSYRSTRQIMAFAGELLPEHDEVEVVQREGPKPRVVACSGGQELADAIASDIRQWQEQGYRSIAVLCKTAAGSCALHEQIRNRVRVRLMRAQDAHFRTGALVMPAYLAKGLEFDAVIIHDASRGTYSRDNERGLFYTACTRALHELHLYYTGEATDFLARVDQELYDTTVATGAAGGKETGPRG